MNIYHLLKIVTDRRLDAIERELFPLAIKFQIGCGAEPTLYSKLHEVIKRAKRANVPYISLVSNGQLLANGHVDLKQMVADGLNELTLSMHGTCRESYEYLMPGANSNVCSSLLQCLEISHKVFRISKFVSISQSIA